MTLGTISLRDSNDSDFIVFHNSFRITNNTHHRIRVSVLHKALSPLKPAEIRAYLETLGVHCKRTAGIYYYYSVVQL